MDGLNFGTYTPEKGLPEFVLRDTDDGDFIPYPSDIAGLTEQALNSLLPRIRAELSGVNSLIELKDFANLPHTLYRLTDTAGRVFTGQFAHLKSLYKQYGTLGNMAKEVGSHFLEWKFNLAPFIADVHSVMKALQVMHDRIIRLLQHSAKGQHRHYSRWFSEFEVPPERRYFGTVFHGPDIMLVSVNRQVHYEPSKFHAEIDYTYGYGRFQTEFAQLLGLLDAFGINLNPATIWRAIPFSFLVDWVVDVGRWFDRLKLRNMEPTLNIRRYLWSVTRSRRIDCQISRSSSNYPPNAYVFTPTGGIPLPTVTETSYGRWTTLPDRTSISSSKLDSEEFTLGVALALSMRRRQTRRNSRRRIAQVTNRKH